MKAQRSGSGWMRRLAASGALVLAAAAAADNRPDIVLILADDLGYGDLGCYGGSTPTPNIDRLAASGVRLTNFYSNGPECTPTRTALMTGRYQQRVGGLECAIGVNNVGRYDDAIRLQAASELGLPPEDAVLASRLAAAGVTVLMAGKWHLGYERKFWPDRHGFQRWFGVLGGGVDYFHHKELEDDLQVVFRDGEPARNPGVYLTDWITDEALALWRGSKSPTFLYVPYTAPHTPYQGPEDRRPTPVPPDAANVGTPETYAAMVRRLDDDVGRLLAELEASGRATNTLIIFTSDNGGTKLARNAPFSGGKGTAWEGGIRVPCLLRWPGRLPAGVVSDHVGVTMDLTASALAIMRAGAPDNPPLDGIDLIGDLCAGRPAAPRRLFWRNRRGEITWRAVRDGTMKYMVEERGGRRTERLFDLAADPSEKNDLLAARPEEARRLAAALAAWEAEVRPRR